MNISKHIPKAFLHFRQHPLNTQCAWICATPCAPRVHVRVTSVAKPGTFTVGCRCSACLGVAPRGKRRKQQAATTSFITVVSEFCINQLCHVMPPPLSNSSEHPQHVTMSLLTSAYNFGQAINAAPKSLPRSWRLSLPSGALAGDRLRQLHPKLLQLRTELHLRDAQWHSDATCESSTTLEPEPESSTPLPNKVMAHGPWLNRLVHVAFLMWNFRYPFNISIFSLLSFSAWETEKHVHFTSLHPFPQYWWQVGRGATAAALRGALGTLGRPGIRTLIWPLICDSDDFLDSFRLTKKHFPAYIFDLCAFLCNWSPCQTSHPKTHAEPFRSSASRSASARSVFNLKCEAISNHSTLKSMLLGGLRFLTIFTLIIFDLHSFILTILCSSCVALPISPHFWCNFHGSRSLWFKTSDSLFSTMLPGTLKPNLGCVLAKIWHLQTFMKTL